ncbi:AAA-type ATPase lid domain-containing protein [Burkholderia cepacia]
MSRSNRSQVKRLREDLYFRIRQQCLHVPALRERPEDIPVLAEHVLLQYNRERQTHIPGISAEARRHKPNRNINH